MTTGRLLASGSAAHRRAAASRIEGRAAGYGDPMEAEVLIAVASSLMVMIPLWRITRRTGRDPWLSLLFLGTPPIGTLVFIAILALGHWPSEAAASKRPASDDGNAER
jgi:hypothetical protein